MQISLPKLPLDQDVETKAILKKSCEAHRFLGELKGVVKTIPNEQIVLGLLPLQEARFSSEIENIVTTQDEVFISKIENNISTNVKEVRNYEIALRKGFEMLKEKEILNNRMICEMQKIIKENDAGFRTQSGTVLKNNLGEVIYTPPQSIDEIQDLMQNLEKFINTDDDGIDPLIKMAIIHHQFESIHPFYDGNGRTGRIINILYLCYKNLLDLPILYLSRYIIDNKADYYRLLQEVREKKNWEEWILYILDAIIFTSMESILFINQIVQLITEFKHTLRDKYPKMYSQDLINALFKYPYTKIDYMSKDLNISRQTASKYLDTLCKEGFLKKEIMKKSHYYINERLINVALIHRKAVSTYHKNN